MKNQSRILALVLTVILTACLFVLPILAEETGSSSLNVTLTTDKAEYTEKENIVATLTVKNTTESAISNLVAQHIAPAGYEVVSGDSQKAIESLAAGESVSVSVTYGGADVPQTGDYAFVAIAAAMIVSAAGLVVLGITDSKSRKGIVSMFLCCILVAGLSMGVSAAELTDSVTATATVKVDGKDVTVSASVSQVEMHSEAYTSETGIAMTISNLLPTVFAGSDAVKATSNDGVFTFTVAQPGTYDLCLGLNISDSEHHYGKITIDAGTAAETSFVVDYAVAQEKLAQLSHNGTSYLTGCSVDLSAGTHTITVSAGKDGAQTAHVNHVSVLAADASAEYVMKIGNTWYSSWSEAMTAADDSTEDVTVTYYADFTSDSTATFDGSNHIVINGNGHAQTSKDEDTDHPYVIKKTTGSLTVKNMKLEHDSHRHLFRIDKEAVVNLEDLVINADDESTSKDGLIFLSGTAATFNVNMTNVKITMAISTDPARDNDDRGCKSGVITTSEGKTGTAVLNLTMKNCSIDATQSGTNYTYAGICVRYGTTANITLEDTTILTGNEYAIRSRKHLSEEAYGAVNLTISGNCVLQSTNPELNNADGYSYGGNGSAKITVTVK